MSCPNEYIDTNISLNLLELKANISLLLLDLSAFFVFVINFQIFHTNYDL